MLEYVFEDSSGHQSHRISVSRSKATELHQVCWPLALCPSLQTHVLQLENFILNCSKDLKLLWNYQIGQAELWVHAYKLIPKTSRIFTLHLKVSPLTIHNWNWIWIFYSTGAASGGRTIVKVAISQCKKYVITTENTQFMMLLWKIKGVLAAKCT